MPETIESREAKLGEKMIEVRVRFWTDELADGAKQIRPKHAWTSGVVRMARNESHDIRPENPRPFNSLMDLPRIIEMVLIEHGIKLHRIGKTAKYIK
jgi:hypothetical protein